MDIKGIIRNAIPFGVSPAKDLKESSRTDAKTDANNDREGNGQATGEEQKRRRLTPEELQEAIEYLSGLAGVKDNNLTVKLEASEDVTVVKVVDRDGKVVRRIPESELLILTSNRQRKSGHLLNRAL